jgi:NAD(P)-dependent dehydrogenase (short-subunit alcohol dehydrogenase family)
MIDRTVLSSLPPGGMAVVIGSTGGIGAALLAQLETDATFHTVVGLSRSSSPELDLCDEASIARAAQHVAELGVELRLVIDATGMLHSGPHQPEKSWQQLDPVHMAQAFAINAIGPALLMKHFLPRLPRHGKSIFATLSAKVGSIGDNQLGGWYSYRASKAALNQLVHTAAIELRRRHPEAVCVAVHPGTVDTGLSAPFAKTGLALVDTEHAAARLLGVVDGLNALESGGFFNHDGLALPW